MDKLLQSSLQPSSLPTYRRAWQLFCMFFRKTFPGVPIQLPFSPPTISLFVAHLYDCQYASSTVATQLSCLGYFHKLHGFPDPSKNFIVSQMMKGYSKIDSRLDSRLPITLFLLHQIVSASARLSESQYNICLFQAMCLFAFHTFSRVGEITQSSSGHNIQLHQLSKLTNSRGEVESLKVLFYHYKHSYNQTPSSISISRANNFCPVKFLLNYLKLRGDTPGPLFRFVDFSPVSRAYFSSKLSIVLKSCSLDPSRYKGHSFRIGAASHAASKGMSDAQIRILGRWKTNAFRNYIRVQSL